MTLYASSTFRSCFTQHSRVLGAKDTYSSVCLFCFMQLLSQLVPLPLQLGHLNLLHLLLLLSAIHFSLSFLNILPESVTHLL